MPLDDHFATALRHERPPTCIIGPIKRFQIKIEAPDWEDFEEVELPRLPAVGEAIDTKYGTLLVKQTDSSPGDEPYEGKIVCRMP